MKKQIIFLSILVSLFSNLTAQKKPNKIGLIKEFSGTITNCGSYDYMTSFTLKDSKLGEIQFHFSTIMNDKFQLDCEINEDLNGEIFAGSANGKKVKVKAKSTYGIFENYQGKGPDYYKEIIWRPIEVIGL
jgi:hypothetical protein